MEVVAFQSFSTSLPSFFFNGRSSKTSTINYSSHIDNCAFKKSVCAQQQLRWSLRRNTQIQRRRVGLPSASSSPPKSFSSDADASTESSVIVGRVPDKAGLVIPVATVSGVHARFDKRQGNLYVTDLNSTNGTYVNERKLNPGQEFPVPPGSRITFGDTHLAIFLVSKMENVKVRAEAQEASGEADALQTEAAN
ncbi:hypothetical protein V2J09_021418 [Rumex salicifolius]